MDFIKKTLAEQIAEQLLARIFSGYYNQGQRLIEAEIAKELQVSHAPVREALYLLQKDGVVEKEQHKGVKVKTISDQELEDYLEALNHLLYFALKKCEQKWSATAHQELMRRFEILEQRKSEKKVFEYVLAVAHILQLFFEVAENVAVFRFFKETTFVTNVAAQTKWDLERIEAYHPSIRTFIKWIEMKDFDNAHTAIKDVILWISILK
ncbi:GntR family transcriptional regulator [Alkalihalobacillus sp. 1P02AB]|uniref:GntR family transcriptional regulator n=1 Tax=Alkalihalobacillus sp. 1P02AB TaxID=3132260 RepID=UPI0039A64D71